MYGRVVNQTTTDKSWYYQNLHPRSSLDYHYIRKPTSFDEIHNNTRRWSLVKASALFKNTDDINKARHEINRVRAHPPEKLKTMGVSYEKFGGLNPKALTPIHCKPPYMSYNYRELRSQGETLQERRKSFAATFEAMTLKNNERVSIDNIENKNDNVMEVRPNEQKFNKMRRGSKFQRGKLPRSFFPDSESYKIYNEPDPKDFRSQEKIAQVETKKDLNIIVDEVKSKSVPLWECLTYNGKKVQHRLGVPFKTMAHKRYHKHYPDKELDLRDNIRARLKPCMFDLYIGRKF